MASGDESRVMTIPPPLGSVAVDGPATERGDAAERQFATQPAHVVAPWRSVYCRSVKRFVDVALTLVLLIGVAAGLLLIALVIRLDSPGPVLFRQTRIGKSGRPFVIYKFRSMFHGGRTAAANPRGDRSGKARNDPRVTRVGRLLRRTSLDELPQLFNVLRGDMSLVGPRPELPEIVAAYQPWQHDRHRVLPGLSGWWQIHGRGDKPMHQHTDLDLYYVRNVSFLLDVRILLWTVVVVLAGRGAF